MLKNKKMFSIIMAIMLVMTMTVSVYADVYNVIKT